MKALFAMASVAAMVAVSPGLAQEKMDKMMDKMESMNCTDADMASIANLARMERCYARPR